MRKIPYLNYKELVGFYTAQSVADLLCLSMQELVEKCEQYSIRLQRDGSGRYVLGSPTIKKLHYKLYHESRGRRSA